MESFEEIYTKYSPVVYSYLRGLILNESLAEELTELTFFKAICFLQSQSVTTCKEKV